MSRYLNLREDGKAYTNWNSAPPLVAIQLKLSKLHNLISCHHHVMTPPEAGLQALSLRRWPRMTFRPRASPFGGGPNENL